MVSEVDKSRMARGLDPRNTVTTSATNPAPVSEITPTQATDTSAAVTPTKASDTQAAAWNKMDLAKQQEFVKANTGFDPNKYGLTYKSATNQTNNTQTQVGPSSNIKLETPKEKVTQTPDYADKESLRLQEIQDNLSEYYQKEQQLFKDRTTFDKFFKYNDRVQEQKDVLDNFYNAKDQERKVAGKSAADIAKSGDDVDFLKVTDPNFYNEIQKEKQNLTNQQNNTNTLLTLAKQYGFTDIDSNAILDQFEVKTNRPSLTDTPEIAAVKSTLNGVDTQIADLDLQIDKIRKDVISQYPGVPDSQISAIVTDRTNKLIDQKNSLIGQKNSLNGQIKTYQDNQALAQKDFELQQSDLQAKITNFQNMYGLYQETPEGIAETAMAKYKAENPDMDTGTPEQQRMALDNALTSYYDDYQSIIQRPKADVIADVLAYAKANNMSVSEALKENFVKPLMGKTEYKQMQDKALGLGEDWTKLNETTLFNSKTGEFKVAGGATGSTGGVGGTYTGPSYTPVDKNRVAAAVKQVSAQGDNSVGGQCGSFVNDYLEGLGVGRIFKDPIDTKLAATNSTTPKIGSIAVIDWSSNPNASDAQKKYGHVGVVIGINGNKITLKQSNKAGEKKVFTSTYDASKIQGYFDPTIDPSTVNAGKVITADAANAYKKLLNTKVIAGASKLSDAERENMKASMEEAIKEGDSTYANEILRGVILSDARVGTPIYDNQQLKSGLSLVRSTLEAFKKNTGDTGVLRAMAEKAANYLGTTTDVQLAKAKNQLGVLVADYIRAISGTAASDVEVQRLISNMPNIKNVNSFNMTLLDNLENIADTKMKSNLELFLGGYKNMAPELFPEIYSQGGEKEDDIF